MIIKAGHLRRGVLRSSSGMTGASPAIVAPWEGASRSRDGERGSAVIVGVIAIALLLVLFDGATNLVLDEYAKGALRTAVDEAAQAGAAAGGSLAACEDEAARVRGGLLHGGFGAHVSVTCGVVDGGAGTGGMMVASASGSLPSLLPAVPGLRIAVRGVSVLQGRPPQ